jgi:hypothetical protein
MKSIVCGKTSGLAENKRFDSEMAILPISITKQIKVNFSIKARRK